MTGLRRFEPTNEEVAEAAYSGWSRIMHRWSLVEQDLHQYYGIDLGDEELLRARSWRWLSARVVGLLSVERGPFGDGGSRLQRALRPVKMTLPKTGAKTAEE